MEFDWKKTLGTIVPGIATMLGGPLAGTATSALISFFGLDPKAPDIETQIQDAIKVMSPEQMIELKKVENDLIVRLKQADIDIFKTEVADRDSARKREISVGSRETALLAYSAVISFVGVVSVVLYVILFKGGLGDIGTFAGGLVGSIVTLLSQKVEQVFSYFFGSSQGSKNKNDTIGNALKNK